MAGFTKWISCDNCNTIVNKVLDPSLIVKLKTKYIAFD